MTSREAAEFALGTEAVQQYMRVKRFFTRFGLELERSYAEAVGGEVCKPPGPDVRSRLGDWQFCSQANTKNAAGYAADARKVPEGHLVQVNGTPRPGYISGIEFLSRHGVIAPEQVAEWCAHKALLRAKDYGEQLTF